MANCLNRRDQMVYSIFQNRAPWGITFLFKRFHGERKCLLGFPTMTTNSFKIPIVQKFENIFTYIFFCIGIYSLFRSISKIHDEKNNLKHKFIHFMHMLTLKKCLHFSKNNIHEWKHSWSKDKQKLPLVDPLS